MSVDNASTIPSRVKRSRGSSLRYASSVMAILPVALGCLLALGTLLLGPSAEAVAGVAAILFGINALIMPRLLDWRIGGRLTALVDTLRAARDGQFERVPHMHDNDAIGDIARLAHDLVAMQAHSGRFALGLHRAKEFAQTSDDMIDRLSEGAHEVERMLAVFEGSTKTLSRVSERFVGNLNAVTTGADRNVQYLVDAASRAIRSAEAMASAAGKASMTVGHSGRLETQGGRTTAQAIDPVLGKLEDLGQAIAGLPRAAELRRICAAAATPVLEKLSELPGQTKASLDALEAPIVEARRTLEAKLDTMDGRIATSRRDADAAAVKTLSEMAILSDAVARVEARLSGIAAKVAPVAMPTVDMNPLMERLALLERPLAVLLERPAAYVEPVDIEPVKAGLVDLASRLSRMEAHALQAAQSAASIDSGPIMDGLARLERPLALLTERAASEPVNIEPVMAGLTDLAARLVAIEAQAAHTAEVAAVAATAVDMTPIIASMARLERPLAELTERPMPSSEPVDLGPLMQGIADLTSRLSTIGADAEQAAHAARAIEILPIIEGIARLERPLALLIERSLVSPDPVNLQPVMQGLAELTSRMTTSETQAEQAAKAAAANAAPVDTGPMVESLARLELSLGRLSERSMASPDAIDLEPVTAGLTDITSRLAAIEAHAASAPAASHPDAGLMAEFDAARAPLQRLLVVFRLALRDIAQESERLRLTVDGLASPDDRPAPPVDLSPIAARLDEVVARLNSVEALTQESLRSRQVPSNPGQLAEFDAAKAPMQRILVGLRLALREISEDAVQFRETVGQIGSQAAPNTIGAAALSVDLSPIAEQLDHIVNRLSSLEVATQEAVRSRPRSPDPSLLADFDAAKAPMQRILVGLRLALREISDSSTEFRETVKQIGSHPSAERMAAVIPAVDLSPIAERLDELAQRFSSIEAAVQEANRTKPAPPSDAIEGQSLPQPVIDRNAMSTALTGLKLMMREISHEASALRDAADALPGKLEVHAPAIDLSPVAERLDDLARRLASIEAAVLEAAERPAAAPLPAKQEVTAPPVDLSPIAEPLAALREELAAGHSVLAEIHAQIGRDRFANEAPVNMAASGTPSLTTTLSLMSAFSSAVEIRFNDIEERIADVAQNYQSDDGRGAGDDLATRLLEAASEMRKEVDQFLAVGAALSGEIETAAKDRKIQSRNAQESRSTMRLS